MILACLLCLAACNKNGFQDGRPSETATITFIRAENDETDTKAFIDDDSAEFTWQTPDTIAVYTTDGYKISDQLMSTYNGTNNATFSFSGENAVTEANRTDFAFFPASLVYDGNNVRALSAANHDASSVAVTLRASYSLTEVQDNRAPTPMIAANAPSGDLSFKSLCPLIRITVINIPKQTRRIEFDFNGKKVQGDFSLTSVTPGTTAITTSATSGTDDIITVLTPNITAWQDQLVVNLPVPSGSYDKLKITAFDATSGGLPVLSLTMSINSSGNWEPTRKSSKKLSAPLPVFSVGDGKKVVFAPGNLVAQVSTVGISVTGGKVYPWIKWYFADHQYDYNTDPELDGEHQICDHFGWVGTGADPSIMNSYGLCSSETISVWARGSEIDVLQKDWGDNRIYLNSTSDIYYENNTWRTLTGGDGNEWRWVIGSNGNEVVNPMNPGYDCRLSSTVNGKENARYAKATIDGVWGLIIFPDVYLHPSEVTAPIKGYINNSQQTSTITYTADEWSKMEAAGAVFLPAAGYRFGTSFYNVGTQGCYWSSTPKEGTYTSDKGEAYALSWESLWIYDNRYPYRRSGNSVRLVRDVN